MTIASHDSPTSATQLEEAYEKIRGDLSDSFSIRMRRAISWLTKAQPLHESNDFDGAFIFFWISFNAMYAVEPGTGRIPSDTAQMTGFFDKLLGFDQSDSIYGTLWERFPDSIRTLVKNQYVFTPYWDYTLGRDHDVDWETELKKSEITAQTALTNKNRTSGLLSIVFDRLYTLRNQLIHGSATYQGSVNRDQVKDGSSILHYLVPQFVFIMLEQPGRDWGEVMYPAISPRR